MKTFTRPARRVAHGVAYMTAVAIALALAILIGWIIGHGLAAYTAEAIEQRTITPDVQLVDTAEAHDNGGYRHAAKHVRAYQKRVRQTNNTNRVLRLKLRQLRSQLLASLPIYREAAQWAILAKCESGNNWKANTGNGYYGGIQADQTFWKEHGGLAFADRPDQATALQQAAVGQEGLQRYSKTKWPHCGTHLVKQY